MPDPRLAPLTLFCFPYAGGSASVFRTWRDLLPGINVRPVTFPGRAENVAAPLHRRMETLVTLLGDQLQSSIDRPFALFGHSMGALVAFELACKFQAAGKIPVHLFVSGCRAPGCVNESQQPLHALSDAEFIDRIARMRGTPPEVFQDQGLMEMIVPMLKADFEIVETYRPATSTLLSCPITASGGSEDVDDIPPTSLTAWGQYTTAEFRYHMLEGDHFFIHQRTEQLSRYILHSLSRSAP